MKEITTASELKHLIAKTIADVIGHGMSEKCEKHADKVLQALGEHKLSVIPRQGAQRVELTSRLGAPVIYVTFDTQEDAAAFGSVIMATAL